jgi:predicted PurR-regulated permease PerM
MAPMGGGNAGTAWGFGRARLRRLPDTPGAGDRQIEAGTVPREIPMPSAAGAETNGDAAHAANGRRAALLLLAAFAAIVFVLSPYLPGVLGAAVLYVVSAGLHRRLARVIPPRVSAAALSITLLLLVLVPGTWLLSTAVRQATDALRAFQRGGALARLSGARVAGVDVGAQLSSAGAALVSWGSGQAVALFGSATRATLNLAIALLGLYYLLVAGDALWRRARALLPLRGELADRLGERLVGVTEAMLLGTFLAAVVQGTLVGLSFWLLGLRGAVLAGLLTACVSVLPVIGSAFVWLPAAAYLALAGRYGAAMVMLALGAGVVSNLDNVIWLAVYRRVSGIHPMVTLLGALGGVRVFGAIGLIFGPLALSYFFELLAVYEETLAHPPAVASDAQPAIPRRRRRPRPAPA